MLSAKYTYKRSYNQVKAVDRIILYSTNALNGIKSK